MYRCYIIWGYNIRIIVVPGLLFLAVTGTLYPWSFIRLSNLRIANSARNHDHNPEQNLILVYLKHIPEPLDSNCSGISSSDDYTHLIPDYCRSESNTQNRWASHKITEQLHGHCGNFGRSCVTVQRLVCCASRGVSKSLGLHTDFDGHLGMWCG